MKEFKKLSLLLALLCWVNLNSKAQNLNWMLGTWNGKANINNLQLIRTIFIDSIGDNNFSGTRINELKGRHNIRIETALSGNVDGQNLSIINGLVLYRKDPPGGEWMDCSDCKAENKFVIDENKILLNSHITKCRRECNGTSTYYKSLCEFDSATQVYLVNRFGNAADLKNLEACREKKPELIAEEKQEEEVPVLPPVTKAPEEKTELVKKESAKKEPEPKPVKQPEVTTAIKEAPKSKDTASAATTKAFETRDKILLNTYHISSPEIIIELHDNAQVDGDKVSVYHNGELMVNNQMLTKEAIVMKIHADAAHRTHEFIMIAENLGRIPPNTALMTIQSGDQVYKLNVRTDLQTNAKIILYYDGN